METCLDPLKISECFASQQNTKAVATLFSKDIAKILQNKILPNSYFGDVGLV